MKVKTKDAKIMFETLTPYKCVNIKRFTTTYYKDNKFYIINNLNERYILVKYNPSLDQKLIDQDYELTLEMQGLKYIPDCLYYDKKERIKITERIYPTANLNFLTKNELRTIASSLRGFHRLKHKLELKPYNPFDIIIQSRAILNEHILPLNIEKEIINHAYPFYLRSEKLYCHNFLLKTNIIIHDKYTYFFDYDYMGSNDPLYDIVMLFISLDIKDEEMIRYFLSTYYGQNYSEEKFDAYLAYVPLVKLVLIYVLRRINKDYETLEFNDIITNLIKDLKNIS